MADAYINAHGDFDRLRYVSDLSQLENWLTGQREPDEAEEDMGGISPLETLLHFLADGFSIGVLEQRAAVVLMGLSPQLIEVSSYRDAAELLGCSVDSISQQARVLKQEMPHLRGLLAESRSTPSRRKTIAQVRAIRRLRAFAVAERDRIKACRLRDREAARAEKERFKVAIREEEQKRRIAECQASARRHRVELRRMSRVAALDMAEFDRALGLTRGAGGESPPDRPAAGAQAHETGRGTRRKGPAAMRPLGRPASDKRP